MKRIYFFGKGKILILTHVSNCQKITQFLWLNEVVFCDEIMYGDVSKQRASPKLTIS
jgi:hypothetical protein